MRPSLARGVRVRPDPRDGTPVLLSPERGLRLSASAAAVVARCDGTRTIAEIVDALAADYPLAGRDRLLADVSSLLADLSARGVVDGVPAPAAQRAPTAAGEGERAAPDGDGSPYTLVAELTHRCPLACPYCSNPRQLVGRQNELTTAEWLGVVDDAAALGVMQLHLSGGEPLARADLEAIADRARARDLYVNLVTSGVPLDRARLERLAPLVDHVQLSVQSDEAPASDRLAGVPCFDQKMRVAGWVKELGLPLTVNVVIHRENASRVGEIARLAHRLGADRLELANVQLVSWALENRVALLPSRAAVDAARAAAAEAKRAYAGRMQVIFVLPDWHADRPRACMDGWGRRFVVVAPDGAVLPCHAARALPLEFERVRQRPLRDVWRDGAALRAYRGEEWMREPCRSCELRAVDFGGCRCQAFALAGDAAEADPACALAPRHDLVLAARRDADAATSGGRRFVFRGR